MELCLIAAASLDGFITRHGVPGTAFTSPADKAHFSATLAGYDASIMGAETYRVARDVIRSRLTSRRLRLVLTRDVRRWETEVVPGQLEFTSEAPDALVSRLRAAGFRRCALLGGAQVHRLFFQHGLVDRVEVSVEPRLFGSGTGLVDAPTDVRLALEGHERLGESDTVVLRYRVIREGEMGPGSTGGT
jgi:dihydrofolate reductase